MYQLVKYKHQPKYPFFIGYSRQNNWCIRQDIFRGSWAHYKHLKRAIKSLGKIRYNYGLRELDKYPVIGLYKKTPYHWHIGILRPFNNIATRIQKT